MVVWKPECCGGSDSDKKALFQLSFMGQLSIADSRRDVMSSSRIVMEQHTEYFYCRNISKDSLLLSNFSENRVI